MKNNDRILLVDDESRVLAALNRSLRSDFNIEIAQGPLLGLDILTTQGPFAVVVSDLRMPGMDGIEFLNQVRRISPDTVRIMLSGNADLTAAIAAVNENHIFRFLTKPCPTPLLARTLKAAIGQYRLVAAERELLHETLMGVVTVLTEVLAVVYPAAFRRSARIKLYVKMMAESMGLIDTWQFEVAAILSQIGCITLPLVTADKIYCGEQIGEDERRMFARHPMSAKALLRSIPRLGAVADMIAGQQKHYSEFQLEATGDSRHVAALGAQMLHIAMEMDRLVGDTCDLGTAIDIMAESPDEYNSELLRVLAATDRNVPMWTTASVAISELTSLMIADEDIRARNGLVLVPKGDSITFPSLERLLSFASELGVVEPVRVLVLDEYIGRAIPETSEVSHGRESRAPWIAKPSH